jgi:hypothetical protein
MKKINFYLLAFCFLFSALSLKAQTQYQLPCSGFEEEGWSYKGGPNGMFFWEFKTNFFYTLNSLRGVNNTQGLADITVERDGNAQQGNYCIKLISGEIPVGADHVFLPGLVGTINEDFVKEFLDSGGNVTIHEDWDGFDTPCALEGWYKYNPVGGDSALIDIGFHLYGSDPVFVEKLILKDKVNNWTKFRIDIPKQYWNVEFTDIRVLFVASAGVNFKQLKQCKGQLGSTLWIDNIYLDYNKSIKQNLFSTLAAKAYPNPATDVLNIELNENFSGKVMIYNLAGSLIQEEMINGTECQVNTSSFATGNYIYKLMNGNTIFAQGKFVVTK